MICTGYSLLALSFMLEPFIQFGEYIVMKYRGKPQIDMWFSWCFALALDVWKMRACEIITDLRGKTFSYVGVAASSVSELTIWYDIADQIPDAASASADTTLPFVRVKAQLKNSQN